MSNTNKILIGVLVAQAVLLAVTWSSDVGRAGSSSDASKLFDVEASAVTALEVTDRAQDGAEAESVKLLRKGEGWVVDGADDFPADTKKVDEVLDKLMAATRRDAVATQAANHNALKVGAQTFDKKVTLTLGGETKVLYLGGAKGSSVHARFDGEDAVYLARGISAWAVGNRVDTYVDAQYVRIDDPVEVRVVNRNGPIDLQKNDDDTWRVAQLRPDAKVDASRARAFVSAARSIRLVEPVGKTIEPGFGLGEGAVTVSARNAEKVVEYRIGAEVGDLVYVKAKDDEYVVKARASSVRSLVEQAPDQFVQEVEPPSSQPAGIPGLPPGMQLPPGMGLPPGMQMPPPQPPPQP